MPCPPCQQQCLTRTTLSSRSSRKYSFCFSVMVAPLITLLAGISWLCSNKTKTLLEHQQLGALFPQEYPWNKNSLQACTDFTQRYHDFKCNSFDLIAKNLCSTWLIVHVCSAQISKGVMQEAHRFIGSGLQHMVCLTGHNLNHSLIPALICVVQLSWRTSAQAHSAYFWFKGTP